MPARIRLTAQQATKNWRQGVCQPSVEIAGTLDLSRGTGDLPARLPADVRADYVDFSGQTELVALPPRWDVYEANLSGTAIRTIPDDWRCECRLDLSDCERLESLPRNLKVGTLSLRGCTALTQLPEGLDVWFLDLSGCWALSGWPARASIRSGRLRLRGCTALKELPDYLGQLSAVDVRDCPNLTSLPGGLRISGWLDIAHSGLTSEAALPDALRDVSLRWGGVEVEHRIAFHPESIRGDEVLREANSERRRVLLDRVGYARFLREVNAEVLDEDTDPGGARQLLRVKLEDDEDLVAMSCYCPSTARQYFIRVPPRTPTCRHAAAWIAGFDNPDDYAPTIET